MNKQELTKAQGIENPKRAQRQPGLKRLLSVKEAASYLNMSLPTFRELYFSGSIPIIKGHDNEKIRVDLFDLDKWIEQSKTRYTF